jgi:manganese transport protein
VAYVDPGNFAANLTAGARYGYSLGWVIVAASLMAMLVQYLAAKLGVATGRDMAELCREHLPAAAAYGLWAQAELMAMATDMAEFVGAAIGLNLLFGMPLLAAAGGTAVVSFAVLALGQREHRRFELVTTALLGLVGLGFCYDLIAAGPSLTSVASGLVPSLPGSEGFTLVAAIVGATIMPHAVYVHSALAKQHATTGDSPAQARALRSQRLDVATALGGAGLVNLAMVLVAAALSSRSGSAGPGTIEAAHAGLAHLVGGGAALAFAVALLASGFSSSSVGTYAGQVIMQGFTKWRVPLPVRRGVTMLPAVLVIGAGLPPTTALVASQVALSFGIPFVLLPLLALTSRPNIMGCLVNHRLTTAAAGIVAAVVITVNACLLCTAF